MESDPEARQGPNWQASPPSIRHAIHEPDGRDQPCRILCPYGPGK